MGTDPAAQKNPGRICVMSAFWMKRPEPNTGGGTISFCRLIIPFGRHHYPPNGWHCRCIVQQISQEDMDRNGWSVSETPEITWREWENKATGEVKRIPVGIAPGFDYNVGIANLRVKAREQVAEKLKKINPDIARTAINSLVRSDDFADFYKNPQGYFAVGVVDNRIKQALKTETSLCCLSDETLLKNQKHHPDLQLDDYLQINKVLQDYDILVQDTEKTVVAVKKISGKNYWLAVKVTRNGKEIFTQTYHLAEDRQLRKSNYQRNSPKIGLPKVIILILF